MTMRLAYETSTYSTRRPVAQPGIVDTLRSSVATLRLWLSRRRERKALLRLDDHMLRDIGIDRFRAEQMAARPFWRA